MEIYTDLKDNWLYGQKKPEKDCDHEWEALGGTVKVSPTRPKEYIEDETLIRCTKCLGYKVAKDGMY